MAQSADDSAPPAYRLSIVAVLSSFTFHVALAAVGILVYFLVAHEGRMSEAQTIIVPNTFEDPALAQHMGTANNGNDALKQASQNRFMELAKEEGWAASSSQNMSSLLDGGQNEPMGIFAGSGASLSPGKNESAVAAYGAPGGAGGGPRSTFYGTGGNATRVVYILDHSGSMLDNFEFLKSQAAKSVSNLVPLQYFAVIMVSDKVTIVGPDRLQQALPDAKKQFTDSIRREVAEGQNDNLLEPFEGAFNKAFAMNPQLIYFLTDGKFGEGLLGKVNALNRDKKVHINTIAFVTEEPQYKGQLQQLAEQNGGTYKFVPQKDVGN
ncbi:MAG TPA: vWA domain-containing protein [Phycisphaerae bacterium]|jgi:hypothetical protein